MNYELKYMKFKQFICELFKSLGYQIQTNDNNKKYHVDYMFTYDAISYLVKIKYYDKITENPITISNEINKILVQKNDDLKLMLIVNNVCSDEMKSYAKNNNIELFDLSNILSLISGNKNMYFSLSEIQ